MKLIHKIWLKERWKQFRLIFANRWSRIPEPDRKTILKQVDSVFGYIYTAALLSVSISMFISMFKHFSYFKCVIFFGCLIPCAEHYFRWVKRDWRDDFDI